MIIGISGAQGQGKTTVIRKLVEQYPDEYQSMDLQTSRDLLNEYGLTLPEINAYPPLKKMFQEALFDNHYNYIEGTKNDLDLQDQIWLVERTFSDIFVYAFMSLGAFNDYSNWVNDYHAVCKQAQGLFDCVFYLSGRTYIPADDGVRSTNPHFAYTVDHLIKKYTVEFGEYSVTYDEISEPELTDRVPILNDRIQKVKAMKQQKD